MPDHRLLICPYCGETQPESDRCRACAGLFEPLSRQATHNAMGPWFIRDPQRPHQPGCSYETLVKLISRGRVTRYTIVRGPTTRQFWTIAKRVPGISHYFGACYQCDASVDVADRLCHACGATFGGFLDRNFLGLPDHRPLPWEAGETDKPRPDVEQGDLSDWRQQAAAIAGGPRGISSFATDEELLGDAEHRSDLTSPRSANGGAEHSMVATTDQTASVTADEQTASEPDAEPRAVSLPEPNPRSTPDPVTNEVTLRALQRKLARQQRNLRTLGYTAIALGAAAIVLGLLWLDLRTAGTAPGDAAVERAGMADEALEYSQARPSDRMPADSPPAAPSADEQEEEPVKVTRFTSVHQAAFDEAVHLIERAEDGQRDLSDRVTDLEMAVAALERLKREVEDSALPDDFVAMLRDARRMLERLRLRQFFP